MQPTKCRIRTGKFSGRSGTPPSSKGPVRSRDLGMKNRERHGFTVMVLPIPNPHPQERENLGGGPEALEDRKCRYFYRPPKETDELSAHTPSPQPTKAGL